MLKLPTHTRRTRIWNRLVPVFTGQFRFHRYRKIRFRIPHSTGFCRSLKYDLSDDANEYSDFQSVGENIYRSRRAINRQLTKRKRRCKGKCVIGDYRGCTEIAKDEERIYKGRSVNEMNVWVSVIFLFSLLRVLCQNVIILSSESPWFRNVNKLRSICHCVMDYKTVFYRPTPPNVKCSGFCFLHNGFPTPRSTTSVHKSLALGRHGD